MEKTQILFRVAQKWHFPTDILTQLACKRKKTHRLIVLFLLKILYRVENNHNRAGNYCNIFGLPTAKTASLRNAFWFLSLHFLQFLSFQTFFHKPGVLSKKKCLKNILLFYTHLSAKILTFLIFFSIRILRQICNKLAKIVFKPRIMQQLVSEQWKTETVNGLFAAQFGILNSG